MTTDKILLILQRSPLRDVSEEEALKTLSAEERAMARHIEYIDTRPFATDVENGHWRSSHVYLRQRTAEIRAKCDEWGATIVRYMGIVEVPHVLAIGAYLGDERLIDVRDFDRDRNTWEWPNQESTLAVEAFGLPREPVSLPGNAVLRVEITSPIQDDDLDAAIGRDRLCDIRIRPQGRSPERGLIKSFADVGIVRDKVREALAAIAENRPNADLTHLFIAAPVSVCIAVGQELRLRNSKSVQAYRYRSSTVNRSLTAAILLTSGDVTESAKPLSPEEIELARELRGTWQHALDDVRAHAQRIGATSGAGGNRWYTSLRPAELLAMLKPFSGLKPMWELIQEEDTVSLDSRPEEFQLCKEPREWRLGDDLVLGMFEAAGRDCNRLRVFARLFFWHEYVHEWQGLTAATSLEVGRLANCLERIDYLADAYAIFHQVDFLLHEHAVNDTAERRYRELLLDQVGVALRSFWAFEGAPPTMELQERRLRRYLNWYWRRVQIRESRDFPTMLRLLARQPCIEISGLRRRIEGERVFIGLHHPNGFERLHLGIVLEDGRLERRPSSVDASIEELLRALSQHDQQAIERFFNAIFDHVNQKSGAFPID